jgi:hypothetical protein
MDAFWVFSTTLLALLNVSLAQRVRRLLIENRELQDDVATHAECDRIKMECVLEVESAYKARTEECETLRAMLREKESACAR